MKKKLLVFSAMLICVLALAGCGSEQAVDEALKSAALDSAESTYLLIEKLAADAVTKGADPSELQLTNMFTGEMFALEEFPGYLSGVEGLISSTEELGNVTGINKEESEVEVKEDEIAITLKVQGDKTYKENKQRSADMEIIYAGTDAAALAGVPTSVTVSVNYDMSELMVKAALNTVLGMGTVFIVLILISWIISGFKYITKITEPCARAIASVKNIFRRKKGTEDAKAEGVENAVARIAEKEEAEADDLELIAVISAAIAAYEGSASTDGFVVRSIIRR